MGFVDLFRKLWGWLSDDGVEPTRIPATRVADWKYQTRAADWKYATRTATWENSEVN